MIFLGIAEVYELLSYHIPYINLTISFSNLFSVLQNEKQVTPLVYFIRSLPSLTLINFMIAMECFFDFFTSWLYSNVNSKELNIFSVHCYLWAYF